MIKKSVFDRLSRWLKSLLDQRGVALIVLLSFVMTMGPMTLYMMDDSLKNHQATLNTVNRIKSFYLAKSALNFSKLILYYSKTVSKKVDESGASAGQVGGLAEPLYRQFPVDTQIFRSFLTAPAGNSEILDDTTETPENVAVAENLEDATDETTSEDLATTTLNSFDKEAASEFLDFDGNFYATFGEENAKYSLNTIAKIESGSASYDVQKRILLQILMNEAFKPIFIDQEKDAEALVHAIGDYVDANNSINEFGGSERGSEESLYSDVDYKPKNAKFLSVSELRLVPGMTDQIFAVLEPLVTVYQTESTINPCLADEEVVRNLILLYSESAECDQSISIRSEDELADIANTVLAFCPDKTDMANALNVSLGLKTAEETGLDFTEATSPDDDTESSAGGSSGTTGNRSAKVEGCKLQFVDFLNEKNDIFTIDAVGEIDEVKTRIKVVLDTSSSSQKGWKVLSYQTQ